MSYGRFYKFKFLISLHRNTKLPYKSVVNHISSRCAVYLTKSAFLYQSKFYHLCAMETNRNENLVNANNSTQPLTAVNNTSHDEALNKDISFSPKSELLININDLSNGNDVSLSGSTSSDITNSCNEISELEVTNATCESLDNFQTGASDNTLEISNCFSEADSSDAAVEKKDTSALSSCSEVTEDNVSEVVSDLVLHSSPVKAEVSTVSESETSALLASDSSALSGNAITASGNEITAPVNEISTSSRNTSEAINADSEGGSSDLSPVSGDDASSGEGDDSEGMIDLAEMYPTAVKWQLRNNNPKLPETVTVLTGYGGSKVYLVGTAHFSMQSQEDVAATIRATQPDVVVLELCKHRINILAQDENTILEEAKNMNFERIRMAIQQSGFRQGALYLLLLNVSAHLTKELGMAPGGEFRRAFIEAKQIPQCSIQLGDRSIHVTLQRVLALLSLWKKLRIAWCLLTSREHISKEDVERCKQKDLLEQMLAEMTGDFPELSEVFLRERDMYLTYSLQLAATPRPSHVLPSGLSPTVVVGVVGMGHIPGIVEKWNTVTENDIIPIISIPKESKSSKVVHGVIRYSAYGLVLYGMYRLIPGSVWQKPLDAIKGFVKSGISG